MVALPAHVCHTTARALLLELRFVLIVQATTSGTRLGGACVRSGQPRRRTAAAGAVLLLLLLLLRGGCFSLGRTAR